MATSECHSKALERLCRICASLLKKDTSKKLEVSKHRDNLKTAFWIDDVEHDHPQTHPKHFCKNCYYTMLNIVKKKRTHCRTKVFSWEPHSDNCNTCIHYHEQGKGGRAKKPVHTGLKHSQGTDIWTKSVSESLKENIPAQRADVSLLNVSDFDLADNPSLNLCKCLLCERIMVRPVMITSCQHAFCLGCLVLNFEGKQEFECPNCMYRFNTSQVIACKTRSTLINALILKCSCGKKFHEKANFDSHKENCTEVKSGHTMTVGELLELDLSDAIPKSVERATLRVLQHKMETSENGTAEFSSGGPRPKVFTSTPKAYKSSDQCCSRTLQRRNKTIRKQLELSTATPAVKQAGLLVKSFSTAEQKEVADLAGLGAIDISPEDMVALKAKLGVPWGKLHTIGRFLKSFNMKVGSQANQRKTHKELRGDNWTVETHPFMVKSDAVKYVTEDTPWLFIPDLKLHIYTRLDLMKEHSYLQFQDQMQEEIHLKIGGDHGGGSFKACYEICNTENPNSKLNSVIFSLFEQKDIRLNLITGLTMFKDQIDDIQESSWNDKKIRVFIMGDYEFLCSLYGITGANGRHPCLLCQISKDEMQKSPDDRSEEPVLRTLETLDENLKKFVESGSNLKNAKHFFNVIEPRLVNVPLDQVSLPALHISLGTFKKFFDMLEAKCYELDFDIAAMRQDANGLTTEQIDSMVTAFQEIRRLNEDIDNLNDTISLIHAAITAEISRQVYTEEHIRNTFEPKLVHIASLVEKKEKAKEKLYKENPFKLLKTGGPCVKALDDLLKSCHVDRKAYHGKSFVGNHVNKMLKKQNIMKLCNAVPKKVCELGLVKTTIHDAAIEIRNDFVLLFDKYRVCHQIINKKKCSNTELSILGNAIKDLMSYFRRKFKYASVTPKLHLLEDHACRFIQRWQGSFGLYGEQGMEGLHAAMNDIMKPYNSMPVAEERLTKIMEQHYIQTNPVGRSRQEKYDQPKRNLKRNATDFQIL